MEKRECFISARKLLADGDIKGACYQYFDAEKADPSNAEAEFFSAYLAYLTMLKLKDYASAANAFETMAECLENAVKYLKEADGDRDEKMIVLSTIVKAYTPIPRFLSKAPITVSSSTIEKGVLSLYALGDAIKEHFGSEGVYMDIAVESWKEGVYLQRSYYVYKYNGVKPEVYASKIRKIDPKYTMPQKSGCISEYFTEYDI